MTEQIMHIETSVLTIKTPGASHIHLLDRNGVNLCKKYLVQLYDPVTGILLHYNKVKNLSKEIKHGLRIRTVKGVTIKYIYP